MHFELLLQLKHLQDKKKQTNKQSAVMLLSPQTWPKKMFMDARVRILFLFFFHHLDARAPHLAVGPAQLDFIHAPKFVDVLSQLVSNFLQVERHDNLSGGRWP